MSQAADLVDSYLSAIAGRDFDAARRLLADQGFSYLSPIASFDDPDAYIASMEGVGAILHSIKTLHRFVDGDVVCHVMDIKYSMAGYQTRRAVQLAYVQGDRIQRLEVLFDASEYHQMIGG